MYFCYDFKFSFLWFSPGKLGIYAKSLIQPKVVNWSRSLAKFYSSFVFVDLEAF